ncbi:ATP-binding protein [Pseudoduganella lurida]|uniref:ATP-binding protein n=1 Tax=Pseudoduganella lurida TaxID=1036180 RepID=UPI001315093F|nr:winged helix-turn-helix domain-containing protein [Pseudoduganella lurida]
MTAQISTTDAAFAFGPFLLVPRQTLLLENGRPVRIGRRAFDVLALLVAAHGRVVGKRELLARAWPGLVVEDGNLKVTIAAIRRLLGEDARTDAPRHIATVVGRGYRFIAIVRQESYGTGRDGDAMPAPQRVIGRDAVLAAIVRDLEDARLVSIVGPGGVGKTAAALAVADLAAGAFNDGCRFADLAPLDDPARVADAIDGALRGRAHGAILLVLDNCEHVVGAVALHADRLLAGTHQLKLIVTSREPLCIRGERVRRLSGLAVPDHADGIGAVDAMAFPAVQLFARCATHAACAAGQAPVFLLDDANAGAVSAICRLLDGLPLAIERAAQRAGTMGAAAVLDHLVRRFAMFDGFHAGPARHRTLTATVHASYVLLAPSEQAVLRRLAVFAGAFGLEAACAVCCTHDTDRSSVMEAIASLVAKSLLLAQPCQRGMAYRQGFLTRAFAMEQLIAHGELQDAQRRQAQGTDA